MKNKNVGTEKEWWEKSLNKRSELKKPYRSLWELYYWKTIFNKIISIYDFNDKQIFDGGCGSGIFEEWLIKKAKIKPKKIVGLDLTEKQIKFAKMRCKGFKKVKFYCGNMEKTNFKNNLFDVCVIIDALHHVPDFFKTLKEMKRIGKDLILSEPNALNPVRRWNELKFRNEGVKETSFYEWQLKKALREIGYKKIFVEHQLFIPQSTPEFLLKALIKIDPYISKIPFINEFSGGLLILAKR